MRRSQIHNRRVPFAFLLGAILAINPLVRAVEFAGGTGEPNDPYLIATPEQFLGADFGQLDVYYRLSSDIDLKGISAISPPYLHSSFRAHLDGAGHRIQHATMNSPEGLLGTIEPGATVTDLLVEDAALSLQGWDSARAVGILAAENHGTITNCHVTGWLAAPHAEFLGGLTGENFAIITNCSFAGFVAGNWTAPESHSAYDPTTVAGLVGANGGSIITCYATGTAWGQKYVGGLVGMNSGSITDCYATTMVIAELGGGGLVARNVGILKRCYAAGWVTGEMSGGLTGLATPDRGTVISCMWDRDLTHRFTSSAGLGFDHSDMIDPWIYSANGWGGEPNWVINDDWMNGEYDYPRLFWEGTKGKPAPEPGAPDWLAGSGTLEDPYQIWSQDDLNRLSVTSILWDKHFVLMQDIAHGPSRTTGVCQGSAFAGTFDGNGHTIRNVHIAYYGATGWNLGMFGYVTGQIRNLTLENAYVTSGPNSGWVGLLAGACEGVIENCQAIGSITVGPNSRYIGGLVGCVAYKGGKVVGCSAEATIQAGEGSTDVGPLIGYQELDGRAR